MKDVEIANQALLDRLSGMAQRASVPPYPHKKGAMDWSKPTDPSCFCGAAPTWYEEYTGADSDCTNLLQSMSVAAELLGTPSASLMVSAADDLSVVVVLMRLAKTVQAASRNAAITW